MTDQRDNESEAIDQQDFIDANSAAANDSPVFLGISNEQLQKLRKNLTNEQIDDFKGVFEMFDVNNDKIISVTELVTIMRQLGQNCTEEEVAKMIED